MKFPGNSLGWTALGLWVMLFGFQGLEAATYLGESTDVRNSSNSSSSSSHTSSAGVSSKSSDDDHEVEESEYGGSVSSLSADLHDVLELEYVPDDWVPSRLRTSLEIGLQHWEPFSSSGQFDADYDIDPVTVTTFDTSVRVKGWVFMLDYKTSLTDPENMKSLLAQVSRIKPGSGLWWGLYAETGEIEGTAETEDELGNPVEYSVDTEWNRIGIELRTYYGIFAGLVWEDLAMPAIHTFNNEDVAFAVFDDQTQARTLSLAVGYDKARYLLNDFKKGGAWAWSLEGSLGVGWLTYSEDESQAFIEAQGYKFESVPFLLAGSLDARLGYTYSFEILNTDMQLYAGGRLRASGWMNTSGNPPEPDTVELDTGFGLVQAGVFGRLSFQW